MNSLPAWSTSEPFIIVLMLLGGLALALREVVIKKTAAFSQTVFNINVLVFISVTPLLPFIPPPPAESFIWMLLAGICYGFGILIRFKAYETEDVSSAYPIFQAAKIFFITLFGFLVFSETISGLQIIALLITIVCIFTIHYRPNNSFIRFDRTLVFLLIGALFYMLYAGFDTVGVRLSEAPFNYIPYTLVISGPPAMLIAIFFGGSKIVKNFKRTWQSDILPYLLGSFFAIVELYSLYAVKMAEVSIYTKSVVIFSAILGVVILREKLSLHRILATLGIFIGIILVALG